MALVNFIRRFLSRDRRQHARHSRPSIRVRYRGRRVQTVDWSLGGCLIPAPEPPFEPPLRIGDSFEGEISGIGLGNSGDFLAEVVRITEEGELGLRWLELDSYVFMALSARNAKKG